jgi:hypothetical protein
MPGYGPHKARNASPQAAKPEHTIEKDTPADSVLDGTPASAKTPARRTAVGARFFAPWARSAALVTTGLQPGKTVYSYTARPSQCPLLPHIARQLRPSAAGAGSKVGLGVMPVDSVTR